MTPTISSCDGESDGDWYRRFRHSHPSDTAGAAHSCTVRKMTSGRWTRRNWTDRGAAAWYKENEDAQRGSAIE